MSDLSADRELMQDFAAECGELLAELDTRLVELERSRGDIGLLDAAFRGFHTIKGSAGFLGLDSLVDLCDRSESVLDRVRRGALTLDAGVMDVILEATASVRGMVDAIRQGAPSIEAPDDLLARLASVLLRARAAPDTRGTQADLEALFDAFVAGAPDEEAPAAAEAAHPPWGRRASDQPGTRSRRSGRREVDPELARENTLRVDTHRLEELHELARQIAHSQRALTRLRAELAPSGSVTGAFDEALGRLEGLVGDLQAAVMRTRQQPAARLFQRYPRLVRDLGRQLGREVALELAGEQTELDQTVIEELNAPLMHLVRNAIDHGIEPPAEREAAGKARRGTLRLEARTGGEQVVIEIIDDGRGMDPARLRTSAVARGLVSAEQAAALDDAAALRLALLPGLSTRDQVSSISGRGVGMDVVRRNIERLNGRIELDSVPGEGTCIAITLPRTLPVLPVQIVHAGPLALAVPLSDLREIVPIPARARKAATLPAEIVVAGETLPMASLARALGAEAERGAARYGIVTAVGGAVRVLAVDRLGARENVVLQPPAGAARAGVSGRALAADGSALLVLELDTLPAAAPG